ncbi:Sugar/inositol transporter [Macleaya cordata]|uniref:Sugar/inositol transporter n=1 Tax=Macleaya cordata TaxID=56857 RepID=A0A200QQ68_MACCD|nr:Sugar/inositol transporter [Macleaya cordata]
MDDFLLKFFPAVYEKKQRVNENDYCMFENQFIHLFTSSVYLAAHVSSFFASMVFSKMGRKITMLVASAFYTIGTVLISVARSLEQLIIGRVLLGFGVGFGNMAIPLVLSEIAPVNYRGAVNILFQLFVTIGIFCANFVNYFVSNIHPWGWRLAGFPGLLLYVCSIVVHETPTSFIDAEFNQIIVASQLSPQVKNPFKKLTNPSTRPPLVNAIMLQVFQQFTGINAIMFYAPVLFQTVGIFKNDASLLSSVIIGIVYVISAMVSIKTIDKFGRRALLLQACCQMFITPCIIGGILLAADLKITNSLGSGEGIALAFLPMMCHMHAGIFFFFAAWILIMGLFTLFLLPETKNIPIDEMAESVWKQHWFWKRYMVDQVIQV